MALNGEFEIFRRHARAIIADFDELRSARGELYRDVGRAGIETVFEQFFQCRGGSFDHFTGGNTSFAAVAGYPSITVPMGFDHELPLGLSFIGRAWSEATLLTLAYGFEQKTRARRAPQFLSTLG